MKILVNKDIDNNKLNEFIYSIFKDNEDTVRVNFENSDEIKIVFENLENKYTFCLPVLYNKQKQELAMLKTGLLKLYNKNLLWGGLVGVRPTKLFYSLLKEGKSFDAVY